ncbi:MAG: hypothetical protein JO097_19690 [Acidobacteriaceae bacterium]|nr:hypothetical protein [Acidobacteriaceae bacterium]
MFHKIAQDIRNCYTVGYVPDEITDKRTVRTVKVVARENGRKLAVRTRTTYTTIPFSELMAQQGVKPREQKQQ